MARPISPPFTLHFVGQRIRHKKMPNVPLNDASRDDRVNEAIASFLDARDRGDSPDPAAYLAKYPDIAGELSQFFADQAAFQNAAVALLPEPALNAGIAAEPQSGEGALATLREYQLLEELGEGGMGTVYKARHAKLKRTVALKVLPRNRTHDAQAIARFEREMEAVGKLEHPNIVRALDAGEHNGTHYLVMEFIDGVDLSKLVQRRGRLALADACELVRQAAVALQHAYEHGLVHRDVKPSNLMLTTAGTAAAATTVRGPDAGGQVKLLDLGLALLAGPQPAAQFLTASNQMMGTADYVAPEQVGDSHAVDIRADIYSLGCTLFKLLTGEAPFSGAKYGSSLQKMLAHRREPIPPVTQLRPDVPGELAAVLNRMCAKQPSDRFATPAEVAAALAPFCAGSDLAGLAASVGSDVPGLLPATDAVALASASTGPFLANSLTGTHPSKGQAFQPDAASPSPARGSRSSPPARRPARRVLIAAASAASLSILAGIVVIIKNRAGDTVAKIGIAEGGGATIRKNGEDVASIPGGGAQPPTEINLAPGSSATITIDDEKLPGEKNAAVSGQPTAADAPPEIAPLHSIRVPAAYRFSAVDVSQDGRYFLASRDSPNNTRVYESRTGTLVHDIAAWRGRFTPNGDQVILDRSSVFDISKGEVVRTNGATSPNYWNFELSSAGTRMLFVGALGAEVWDWSTGKKLSAFPWKLGNAGWLEPDGLHFLQNNIGRPPLVAIDTETGNPVDAYGKLRNWHILDWCQIGKRILCVEDGLITVYDPITGDQAGRIDCPKFRWAGLSIEGGRVVANLGELGTGGVWDVDSGRLLARLKFPEAPGAQVIIVAQSRDGAVIAIAVNPDSVYVFKLPELGGAPTGGISRDIGKHPDQNRAAAAVPIGTTNTETEPTKWSVNDLPNEVGFVRRVPVPNIFPEPPGTFSRDGRLIGVPVDNPGYGPDHFRVIETATGRTIRDVGYRHERLAFPQFLPDGNKVLLSTTKDLRWFPFRLWNLETGLVRQLDHIPDPSHGQYWLHFSDDGRRLAMSLTRPSLYLGTRVIDVESGTTLVELPRPSQSDGSARFEMITRLSGDGTQAITASMWNLDEDGLWQNGQLRIDDLGKKSLPRLIDVANLRGIPFANGTTGEVGALCSLKGGGNWIEYFNATSGKSIRRVPFGGNDGTVAAIADSGTRVAGIDIEKRIHVYELPTGNEVLRTEALPAIQAGLISADGRMLAFRSGSELWFYRLPDPTVEVALAEDTSAVPSDEPPM
jgi:serine/threonine protein kinase